MADRSRPKPQPARPAGRKPTSARELGASPTPRGGAPDLGRTTAELDGERWTVRVLGRSGRASGASPPLLLLGFWEDADSSETPSLEALVVGRALDDLSTEALELALRSAAPPRDPEQRPGFFREAAQGRRRRPNEKL